MDLAKASASWFAANMASATANLLAVIYFSRELGASIVGLYFLFFSLLQVFNFAANGGLSSATIKRISEGGDPRRLLSASLILRTSFLALLSLAAIILKEPLRAYLDADLLLPLIAILFLLQFSDLIRELLQGTYRVGVSAFIDLCLQISKVILQVLLLGYGLLGLIWGLGAGIAFSIFLGTAVARLKFERPGPSDFTSLLKFSKYSYGTSLGGLIYEWLGLLAIGYFSGSSQAGIFGVCWSLSAVFLLFSQAVSSSIFPRVSSLAAEERLEDVTYLFREAVSYGPILAMPAFFGALALGRPLLSLLYGEECGAGAGILTALMATRAVQSVQMVTTRTLDGLNRPDMVFNVNLVTTSIDIVATLFLAWLFGPMGAALAALLTIIFSLTGNLHGLSTLISIRFKRELGLEVAASILMYFVVVLAHSLLGAESLAQLAILISLGACIYLGIIIGFSPDLRGILSRLLQKS
jgi:O-antigen/teichoic acid export membrane protein